MKVFFTCSTKDINKYAGYYRATRKAILENDCELTRDWIEYSIDVALSKKSDLPSPLVYDDVMSAIFTTDLIIADVTVRSMSIGHQLTYALAKKKPILLLININSDSAKKKLFIEGSKSQLLTKKVYSSEADLRGIIKEFIAENSDKPEKRLNLKLTNLQNKYLDWSSFFYKRNKTSIVHEALDKRIEKDDHFRQYLNETD